MIMYTHSNEDKSSYIYEASVNFKENINERHGHTEIVVTVFGFDFFFG